MERPLDDASVSAGMGRHFWHDEGSEGTHQFTHALNGIQRDLIMQRWKAIQHDVFPELRKEVGALGPKLERVVYFQLDDCNHMMRFMFDELTKSCTG